MKPCAPKGASLLKFVQSTGFRKVIPETLEFFEPELCLAMEPPRGLQRGLRAAALTEREPEAVPMGIDMAADPHPGLAGRIADDGIDPECRGPLLIGRDGRFPAARLHLDFPFHPGNIDSDFRPGK